MVPCSQPVEQVRFIRLQAGIADAGFLKTQLMAPALDLPGQTGEVQGGLIMLVLSYCLHSRYFLHRQESRNYSTIKMLVRWLRGF